MEQIRFEPQPIGEVKPTENPNTGDAQWVDSEHKRISEETGERKKMLIDLRQKERKLKQSLKTKKTDKLDLKKFTEAQLKKVQDQIKIIQDQNQCLKQNLKAISIQKKQQRQLPRQRNKKEKVSFLKAMLIISIIQTVFHNFNILFDMLPCFSHDLFFWFSLTATSRKDCCISIYNFNIHNFKSDFLKMVKSDFLKMVISFDPKFRRYYCWNSPLMN